MEKQNTNYQSPLVPTKTVLPIKYDKWANPNHSKVKIKGGKNPEIEIEGENVGQIISAIAYPVLKVSFYLAAGGAIGWYGGQFIFTKVIPHFYKKISTTTKSGEKEDGDTSKVEKKQEPKIVPSVTMEEIFADDSIMMTQEIFLLGEIFTAGDTMMIYSGDGVGKSQGSMQIFIDLANGWETTLLPDKEKMPIAPKHEIYIYDIENKKRDLKKKYQEAGIVKPGNLHIIKYIFNSVEEYLKDVEMRVMETNLDVIIGIDNIKSQFGQLTQYESRALIQGLNEIKERLLIQNRNLSVILITHSQKSDHGNPKQDFAGTAILGQHSEVRMFLSLSILGNNIIMMEVEKNRNHEPKEKVYLLKRVKHPYLHLEYIGKAWKHEVLPTKKLKPRVVNIYEPSRTFDFNTLELPNEISLKFHETGNSVEFNSMEETVLSEKERFIQKRREGVKRLFQEGKTDKETAILLTQHLEMEVKVDDVRNDRRFLGLSK